MLQYEMSFVDIDDFDFCDWFDDTNELMNQLRAAEDADQAEPAVDEFMNQSGDNEFRIRATIDGGVNNSVSVSNIEHSSTRCCICRLSTNVGLRCNKCYPISE